MTGCSSCGAENPIHAAFCDSCGTALLMLAERNPTPPPSPFDTNKPAKREKPERRGLLIALVATAGGLLLLAGAGAVGFMLLGADNDSASPGEIVIVGTAKPTAPATKSAPEPSETPNPAPKITTPNPNGEVVRQFKSPSGNIRCSLNDLHGQALATCQQVSINYSMPPQACTTGTSGVLIAVNGTGTFWPCLPANIEPTEVLALDTAATYRDITCTINYVTGVTCQNARGHGFTMEYDRGVQLF